MYYNEIENESEKTAFRASKEFYCVFRLSFENETDRHYINKPPQWCLVKERDPVFSEKGKWLGLQWSNRDAILEEYLFNNRTEAEIFMNEELIDENELKRDRAIEEIENLKREIEELKKQLAEESKEEVK